MASDLRVRLIVGVEISMVNLICGTVSLSMSLRFMTCMRCGVVRYLLGMYGFILWVGCRKEETRKRENRVNPSFQITATSTWNPLLLSPFEGPLRSSAGGGGKGGCDDG